MRSVVVYTVSKRYLPYVVCCVLVYVHHPHGVWHKKNHVRRATLVSIVLIMATLGRVKGHNFIFEGLALCDDINVGNVTFCIYKQKRVHSQVSQIQFVYP